MLEWWATCCGILIQHVFSLAEPLEIQGIPPVSSEADQIKYIRFEGADGQQYVFAVGAGASFTITFFV